MTYTITVTNGGPSDVVDAPVTDVLPAALTGAAWTCGAGTGGGTCDVAAGTGDVATTVDLPAGATVTITLTATVAPSQTAPVANTATVDAPAGVVDPTPGNNAATDTDTMAPAADVSITKTDGVASAVPGQSVTYTVIATNAGPSDVVGAPLLDPLPAGAASATWTCAGAAGGACPTSGTGGITAAVDLPVGATVTFTVVTAVAPTATGLLVNTASISVPVGVTDPDPADDVATDVDALTPLADLGITKTDGLTTALPGDTVTYTIVVTNAGPSAVVGAPVSDLVPAELENVSWTCASVGGSCADAAGTGDVATTVDLGVGATATFTLTADVVSTALGAVANTATVDAPAGVTDPVAGQQRRRRHHLGVAARRCVDHEDRRQGDRGRRHRHELLDRRHQPGSVVLSGVRVVDALPAALTGATWVCTPAGGATCRAVGRRFDRRARRPARGQPTVTFTVDATIDGVGDRHPVEHGDGVAPRRRGRPDARRTTPRPT